MPCVFSSSRPSFFPQPGLLLRLIVPSQCCRADSDPPVSQLPSTVCHHGVGSARQEWHFNNPNQAPSCLLCLAQPSAGSGMIPNGFRPEGLRSSLCSFSLEISHNGWGRGSQEWKETWMPVSLPTYFPTGICPALEPLGITPESWGFYFQGCGSRKGSLRCPMGSCTLLGSRYVGYTPQCPLALGTPAQGTRVFSGSFWVLALARSQP